MKKYYTRPQKTFRWEEIKLQEFIAAMRDDLLMPGKETFRALESGKVLQGIEKEFKITINEN